MFKLSKMIWEFLWINFSLIILKLLNLLTFDEVKICQYHGISPCTEIAWPNKKFCVEHYRLEREFRNIYHSVQRNKGDKYMEVGIYRGYRPYTVEEQNRIYSEFVNRNRNVINEVELQMRLSYAVKFRMCTWNKPFGNVCWELFLKHNINCEVFTVLFNRWVDSPDYHSNEEDEGEYEYFNQEQHNNLNNVNNELSDWDE